MKFICALGDASCQTPVTRTVQTRTIAISNSDIQVEEHVEEADCLQYAGTSMNICSRKIPIACSPLFRRVHQMQAMMIEQIYHSGDMSPKEYQGHRQRAERQGARKSRCFRHLLKICTHLGIPSNQNVLQKHALTVEKIYNSQYDHGTHVVARRCRIRRTFSKSV